MLKMERIKLSECAGQGWAELRWYAQSESIIITTHSKTIVLQDYSFYLLVFFLSFFIDIHSPEV